MLMTETKIHYCSACQYPLVGNGDIRCMHCEEVRQAMTREVRIRLAKISFALGGDKAFNEYTHKRFIRTPANQKVFDYCSTFLPIEDKDNIFIYSKGNGTGKTHLAAIALRRLLELDCTGRLLKPSQIYRVLRSCEDAQEEIKFIDSLIEADCLVIDDVDAAKDSEYTIQTLYDIIDGRYMRACGGLIVTANSSLNDLECRWKNGRITSRLYEMVGKNVFCLDGIKDYRRTQ